MGEPRLRVATLADAPAIADIYGHYVRNTAISFELEPPDAETMRGRLADVLSGHPWLVADQAGEVIGYAYAGGHRPKARAAYAWSVDTTIYLCHGLQRRGLGRRLYRALLEVVRRQGFYRAYGGIALPNDASVGLHEAMGFSPIGVYRGVGYKLGAWRDVGWWGLDLTPLPAMPQPPAPFDAAATTAWLQASVT
ncbi:arsinothricin resistance N-acetyltransferase ArsN1 family B [Caulobacter sp. KR2-114]|uniref:arsinothricin resistance N-acetyltransferase ArsN1 family B n=1 Tax=Caulobacter sp. KR2-114 TaxID=3400912 RepID=UPI003BFF0280